MTGHKPNKATKPGKRRVIFIITYAIVLFWALYKFDIVWGALQWVLRLLSPLFLGIAFAYLFYLPTRFFQRNVFKSWKKSASAFKRKAWQGMSMLLAYCAVFLTVGALFAIMLPRIIESIVLLAENFPRYIQHFQTIMDGALSSASINPDLSNIITDIWSMAAGLLEGGIAQTVSAIVNFTLELTSGVANFFMALALSGFILYNREKLFGQLSRLFNATLGQRFTQTASHVARTVDGTMGRYLHGKIIEALILGCLTLIGMAILGMDYAPLISVIIAATSLIPVVGGIIGTIPSALILLLVDPGQALGFLVFIILLQIVEGNLISPRVVGGSIGLSGLWMLLSVIVGGGLFGIWGMLLGPPVFAALYRLLREWLHKREIHALPRGGTKH